MNQISSDIIKLLQQNKFATSFEFINSTLTQYDENSIIKSLEFLRSQGLINYVSIDNKPGEIILT